MGTSLDVYVENKNENIINIFVGGINNQIDTGFDINSLFKPYTFIAKFIFDKTINNLTLYKHILKDVDRRYPRFERRITSNKEFEDERMWGDVRDIKLGNKCAAVQKMDSIRNTKYIEEIPCLYVIGYSPSLRATYIHKINVETLETISPILSLP
eukprot:250242_1